jgi:hypothetical protein
MNMNGGYVESRKCLLDANRFVRFVVDSSSLTVSLLLKLNSLADYTCCPLKIGCRNDFPGAIRELPPTTCIHQRQFDLHKPLVPLMAMWAA